MAPAQQPAQTCPPLPEPNTNPSYSTPHYDPALIHSDGSGYVCTAAE